VTIGIKFHWERKEDQAFQGNLKLATKNGKIVVINEVPLETYLTSVISSEMSATCPPELLKAHAVISRSWLLAQLEKSDKIHKAQHRRDSRPQPENEICRWYDREDHDMFDVCADDHCQRYQGITKVISADALEATRSTSGQVLLEEGEVCDTRFSKCCGGISENYENVWEDVRVPYLVGIVDNDVKPVEFALPIRTEADAEKWILGNPPAYCNTTDETILRQILLSYDQETKNFYRWEVEYKREELERIILEKSGVDFGTIMNLVPLERGISGRLIKLRIEGTKRTITIGKELEIRKTLSKSHLYSSAFIVRMEKDCAGVPRKIKLIGAGWGHGVGLCQIGAAVMAAKGTHYEEILLHYFTGAHLKKIY
jgi:SpoIID/LytB domain protein